MTVDVDTVVADEGTIIVLEGTDRETGDRILFGADHRPAGHVIEALAATGEPVPCEVGSWQVLCSPTLRNAASRLQKRCARASF
jgi:hypothetical protein